MPIHDENDLCPLCGEGFLQLDEDEQGEYLVCPSCGTEWAVSETEDIERE